MMDSRPASACVRGAHKGGERRKVGAGMRRDAAAVSNTSPLCKHEPLGFFHVSLQGSRGCGSARTQVAYLAIHRLPRGPLCAAWLGSHMTSCYHNRPPKANLE